MLFDFVYQRWQRHSLLFAAGSALVYTGVYHQFQKKCSAEVSGNRNRGGVGTGGSSRGTKGAGNVTRRFERTDSGRRDHFPDDYCCSLYNGIDQEKTGILFFLCCVFEYRG